MSDMPQRPQRPQRTQKPQNSVSPDVKTPVNTKQFEEEEVSATQNVKNTKMTTDEKIALYESERKKRRKKAIIIAAIVFVVVTALGVGFFFLSTGLNDSRVVRLNAEVADLKATLQSTIESKDKKISELKKAVEDTTVKEVVPETSLQRVEGSEVPEFWLIEGDFIAPNKLAIPETFDDVNNSNIQIGTIFKFIPSENWLIAIKGTTVEFSHPSKIWGKVKALGHNERIASESEMKQIIQNFFIGYPSTTISYRKIFMDDMVAGYMGKAAITVKDTEAGTEKEMILNVGFAQRGDYTISFLFANDKESMVAQELIDLLLRSITFGDSKMKIE